MIHSIAVATDYSRPSKKALAVGAQLARRFEARLQVVHVVPDRQQATPLEADHLARFALAAGVPTRAGVESRLLIDTTPGVLRRFQESEGVDLIVVASHSQAGVRQFLDESFAVRVSREVTAPVLVFRFGKEDDPDPPAELQPHRILVPHDFSIASAASLAVARSWALAFQACVRLLHVESGTARPPEEATGRPLTTALDRLRGLVQRDWGGIPAETVTCEGNPAEQIPHEATLLHADLIIMASHGESLRGGNALGSVTERTIHEAPCPVLVVKSFPGEDWAISI